MPQTRDVQAILNELVRRANESSRRLRALEERSSLIETRTGSMQDSILKIVGEERKEEKELNLRLKKFENNFVRIDNDLMKINKNLDKMVKRVELKEVENLISIFNPLKTNFVTREDVEKIIKERMR